MLINPEKMVLVYKSVKFEDFELERVWLRGVTSYVQFVAPICGRCLYMNRLTEEQSQKILQDDSIVSCGVEECTNPADFYISFNFGFEERDVDEQHEEDSDPMEEFMVSELNFD